MGSGQTIPNKCGQQAFGVGTEGNIDFWKRNHDDAIDKSP